MIKVTYDNYKELEKNALERGTAEDVNALGEWFENFGTEFWNGEYFTVDEKKDIRLFPIYKEVAEDEFEVIGYELR